MGESRHRFLEPKGTECLNHDNMALATLVEDVGGFGQMLLNEPAKEVQQAGGSGASAAAGSAGSAGTGGTARSSDAARDSVLLVQVQLPIHLTRDAATGKWEATWDEEALLAPKAQMEALRVTGGGGWLSRVRVKWIGLPPVEVPPNEEETVRQVLEPLGCIPVYIEPTTLASFREGYCKGTLYPVFHNVVDVYGDIPTRWWHKGQQSGRWKAYTNANARFAATVVENYHDDDLVWIHVRCAAAFFLRGQESVLFPLHSLHL